MSNYPEHEKLAKVADRAQIIGEFLDTLPKDWTLAAWARNGDELYPLRGPISSILATYFGIDEAKLEQEKRAMLDEQRAATARGYDD